jgi:hypothetical protein
LNRAKTRKQTKAKARKRGLPWFAWLLIALGLAGVVVCVRLFPMGQPSPNNEGELKAVIVDQLSSVQENDAFVTNVTEELEVYGFEVDICQGGNVTVDFYRDLAIHGYKLIIFRAHSGLLAENEVTQDRTVLFTNEDYSQAKYVPDQLNDRLVMARVSEGYPMVFGIPPKFITESMKGTFDDAVVIMMGCSGLFVRDLAQAFVEKGASVYVGWNGSVELYYIDEATPYLIEQLCSKNRTIKEAVDNTMDVSGIGPDPEHGSGLKYYPTTYPRDIGDKTLRELVD